LDSLVAELGVPLAKLPIIEEELQTACAKYRARQNPTSRTKSNTSQQKTKNESDTEGFQKVNKHENLNHEIDEVQDQATDASTL
ncbi:hypothetical protein CDAR_187701, partial [Caerostris darwini]